MKNVKEFYHKLWLFYDELSPPELVKQSHPLTSQFYQHHNRMWLYTALCTDTYTVGPR